MSLTPEQIQRLIEHRHANETWSSIAQHFFGYTPNALRKAYYRNIVKPKVKILYVDIETSPIIAHVWRLWDQNVALNQIVKDSAIMSWSANWEGSDEIIYRDNRKAKDSDNDSGLMDELWDLYDQADIVIGHNVKKFDNKRIRSRMIKHGKKPMASCRVIDTLEIVKNLFDATSNKLEFWAEFLEVPFKKLKHNKFPGHLLWVECLKGNLDAWDEMQRYNKQDVLVLKAVYERLKPYDKRINFNVYHDSVHNICSCGSTEFKKHPKFHYTNAGKYDRFICVDCGKEHLGKTNLLTIEKRKAMLK